MRTIRFLSIAVCLLAPGALAPALAVDSAPEGSLQAHAVRLPTLFDVVVGTDDPGAPAAAFERFVATEGGSWTGRLHAGSGRAALLSGSGLPIMPGRGNALDRGETVDLLELERRVRALVERHPGLLGTAAGALRLSRNRSGIFDGGRLAYVDFDLTIGGRTVRGARSFVRINSGNVVQVGSRLLGGSVDTLDPVLTAADAIDAMFDHVGGQTEIDIPLEEPDLFYIPVEEPGGLVYRLVWETAFQRRGEVHTWTAHVDARTGTVLEFFDSNKYGNVTGGVFPRTVTDAEIVVGMPFTTVTGAGTTDRSGNFAYSGGSVSAGLDGLYFNTDCQGCANPGQTAGTSDVGLGWIALGTGGADATGNGVSIRADRVAYYHLNVIRELAKKWIDIPWLDTNIRINTNVQSTCNATWGGEVNVYRSGGGCNNTGEIADVLYHEWGHGIDGNTLGGDSATGEGTGDTVSFSFTHGSQIGPWFRTTGEPVRDVNKDTTSKGLLTRGNLSSKCSTTPPCLGPLGYQCHCEGEIYGQTGWDLAQSLVAKHGFHTGWQEHERIFYSSLPQAGSYLDDQANSIYDAYLAADDDDGNLNNGTPNGAEIFAAFDLHEIAPNGQGPSSTPGCTRPAEPVVSASAGCDGITLSWAAVPGATEYRVMRNEVSATAGFLRVASVTGTSYVDGEVLPDVTYHYVVEAVDGGGCTSTIEGVQSVAGPARPILSLVSVATDDVPMGNRSGTVDPGEAVDLILSVENFSSHAAGSISASIATSEPGITIDLGSSTFPNLAGFASGTNDTPIRFSLAPSVTCGDDLEFTLTLTDDSGCTLDTQFFRVPVGIDAVRLSDDFSTDNGWSHDVGSSTATTGDWLLGEPVGTSAQPGSDSNDAGTFAWYTGANPGGAAGTDDVDGGEVVLVSPVFDLSALTNPVLRYQRWFYNDELGDDAADHFIVEASDNGGGDWKLVETLGDSDNEPAWTDVGFDLAPVISLTNDVRFRVRVADGTAATDLLEGAMDDFRITEAECDLTPPCFVAPNFAGIANALAGPDCAEVALDWAAATSNCTNATITYSVYRSTTPGFTPDASNRIAENLTALSFADTLLAPGQDYHYIVRAFDSRSGEDANAAEFTVTAPVGPDTKAPLFAGLATAVSGSECGETALDWTPAQETCSTPVRYNVYRSTTPGFVPGPSNLVASTTDTSLVDAGIAPNTDLHYVVRAVDAAGLEDANGTELTVEAKVKDLLLALEDFEAGANGWAQGGTNDATTGLWELGDPVGTAAQPDDCASGTSCWATGLSGPGLGDNDIDGGTTTLLSPAFDLTGLIEPGVRYARYYSNNTGSTPGTDTWVVEISNDDGANWSTVESTNVSDEGFVYSVIDFPLMGILAPTNQMRIRFVASDLADGSLVEAVVDDFRTVDFAGGCSGCGAPPAVGVILVTLDGDDVLVDWTGDPVAAGRFKIYDLTGADFSTSTLLGTADAKTYRHADGALVPGSLTAYRVSAVDACGQEGALQ